MSVGKILTYYLDFGSIKNGSPYSPVTGMSVVMSRALTVRFTGVYITRYSNMVGRLTSPASSQHRQHSFLAVGLDILPAVVQIARYLSTAMITRE